MITWTPLVSYPEPDKALIVKNKKIIGGFFGLNFTEFLVGDGKCLKMDKEHAGINTEVGS